LEAASGGTIFFDEIAEMPLPLQVKLLRVLEEKTLYRLGGVKEIPVDFRIICATNQNLHKAVELKQFRLDLYYRINMGHIQIPPLRDRRDDILPLAHRFVVRAFRREGKKFEQFSPAAEKFLQGFAWPGNVRQLKNTMERLAILNAGGYIQVEDLSFVRDISVGGITDDRKTGPKPGRFELPPDGFDLEAFNRHVIEKALALNEGNQTRTAQYLGISRRVLQGRLQKIKSAKSGGGARNGAARLISSTIACTRKP
jgi:transcriptional regulator with PAS, ATPase and Fis domain